MDARIYPPTQKGRIFELCALGLRDFAKVKNDGRLDPFELARFAKLLVVDFSQIVGLSLQTQSHLLGEGANSWSGGTASQTLPNGWKLVILNPTHGPQRNNATLMEEICHVFLGHKANRLAIVSEDRNGKMSARDYNESDEEAAYAVGAAALAPYSSLLKFVLRGMTSKEIGRHFDVSRDLVEYRLKVSRLWEQYKARQGQS